MKRMLFYALGLWALLLGLCAPLQANLDGTSNVVVVPNYYYFSDGEWARGYVYFQNGFNIPANATVTLGIVNQVTGGGYGIDIDPTATVMLETPLWFQDVTGIFLKGTFSSGPIYPAPHIIFDVLGYQGTTRLAGNTFFPKGGMLDFKGTRFTTEPYRYCVYWGDASSGGQILILKNVHAEIADLNLATLPNYRIGGVPAIQPLFKGPYNFYSPPSLYLENATLDVVQQLTLNDAFVEFQGNCFVRNADPFKAIDTMPGALQAKLKIDSPAGANLWISLDGPTSVVIGPDVELYVGNLGQPFVDIWDFYNPCGGFVANNLSSGRPLDVSLTLADATLTFSRKSVFEGGARLVVQGSCDLSSTATDVSDRVLTFGRSYNTGNGTVALDAALDIQTSSVLNVHNMVLNNNNNP